MLEALEAFLTVWNQFASFDTNLHLQVKKSLHEKFSVCREKNCDCEFADGNSRILKGKVYKNKNARRFQERIVLKIKTNVAFFKSNATVIRFVLF